MGKNSTQIKNITYCQRQLCVLGQVLSLIEQIFEVWRSRKENGILLITGSVIFFSKKSWNCIWPSPLYIFSEWGWANWQSMGLIPLLATSTDLCVGIGKNMLVFILLVQAVFKIPIIMICVARKTSWYLHSQNYLTINFNNIFLIPLVFFHIISFMNIYCILFY